MLGGLQCDPLGAIDTPTCDDVTDSGSGFPPLRFDDDLDHLVSSPIKFGCCRKIPLCDQSAFSSDDCYYAGWLDFYGRDAATAAQIADRIENYTLVVWQLEVTGDGTAVLKGFNAAGDLITTYNCEEFNCIDRSTFHRDITEEYPLLTTDPERRCVHLPNHVCVVPAASQWRTPCDPPSAACACCDPGADSATFSVCLTCGIDEECHNFTITRNTSLPTGVTEPDAPCGYWWGTFSHCDKSWGALIYCDGEDYQVELWCLAGESPVKYCDTTATLTQCCPEWRISFTCSGDCGDCQCAEPPIDTECCEAVPATLTMTIASCSRTATLTYAGLSGGNHIWSGDDNLGADWLLTCTSGGVWLLSSIECSLPGGTADATCDPLLIDFTIMVKSACCPPGGAVTAIVSA
jgi:hypothetical protein